MDTKTKVMTCPSIKWPSQLQPQSGLCHGLTLRSDPVNCVARHRPAYLTRWRIHLSAIEPTRINTAFVRL
jgi:hypothetical protein